MLYPILLVLSLAGKPYVTLGAFETEKFCRANMIQFINVFKLDRDLSVVPQRYPLKGGWSLECQARS